MNTAYYVNNSGLDTNPGTLALPWQTIAKVNTQWAAGAFGAGDSINFQSGQSFSGSLALTSASNGASGNPITLTTYGVGTPATLLPASAGSAIVATNCQYFTVSGLTITGANPSPTSTSSPNYLNCQPAGISVLNTLGNSTQLAGITISNCTISGFVSGITAYATVASQTGGTTGLTISNCTIYNCTAQGIQTWSDDTALASRHYNLSVKNNNIYNITGYAVNGNGSGNPLALGMVNGGTISGNTLHDSGQSDTHTSGGGPGGLVLVYSQGVTIDGNIAWNIASNVASTAVDGFGFDVDMQCTNCTVQRNYAYNCGGAGFGDYGAGSGNIFRWNVGVNNDSQKGTGAETKINSTTNALIHNNTFINWRNNGSYGLLAQGTNPKVFNNVVITNNAFYFVVAVATGATIDGNRYYYPPGGGTPYDWNGTYETGLAAFRTASSQETNGSEGDPQLLNDCQGGAPAYTRAGSILMEFIPAITSPIAYAGINLLSVYGINPGTSDINGNAIPANYYAAGAVAIGASFPKLTTVQSNLNQVLVMAV